MLQTHPAILRPLAWMLSTNLCSKQWFTLQHVSQIAPTADRAHGSFQVTALLQPLLGSRRTLKPWKLRGALSRVGPRSATPAEKHCLRRLDPNTCPGFGLNTVLWTERVGSIGLLGVFSCRDQTNCEIGHVPDSPPIESGRFYCTFLATRDFNHLQDLHAYLSSQLYWPCLYFNQNCSKLEAWSFIPLPTSLAIGHSRCGQPVV